MTAKTAKHRAHLTLIELLIAVVLLGGAGFFLVRGMGIAREREQRRQMAEAIEARNPGLLFWGQQSESTKRIWALLKANPKLHDAKSDKDQTPLHYAAYKGEHEMAQWLLDNGADVNAKDILGKTPLHWAAYWGQKEIVELLLAKGADVSATEGIGSTPLHEAASSGHKEVIELLLSNGADINAKAFGNATPLDYAVLSNRHEIIDLLRQHGARRGEEP